MSKEKVWVQNIKGLLRGVPLTDEMKAACLREFEAALSTDAEPVKTSRFGHHPEPAIDFCIEVEALEGHLFDAKHGIGKPGHEPRKIDDDFRRRISSAMDFIVGGDQIAIAAKATLRSIADQVKTAPPVATVAEMGVGGMRVLMPHPPGSTQHLPIGTKLYAAPPAPAVAVKDLEWVDKQAQSILGPYWIASASKQYLYVGKGKGLGSFDTVEEAKAAAQADYEARIRSALSAQVQDVATKTPYENDAVWARFYRDGKTLGEICEEFKCGIYDLSPWLTTPLSLAAAPAAKPEEPTS